MRSNRIMWGFVALTVLITIAVTFGTLDSHSQQKPQPTPARPNNGYDDVTKYATADYDAPEPTDAKEREERKNKSQRYDGQHWILKNPQPDDGKVGRYDEDVPPLMIPVAESDLIVIGDVTNVNAYLSTDKKNVYSEFTICIEDILKEDSSKPLSKGACITADREGGFVRYSNGQKVRYERMNRDLPGAGRKYVLFLTNDKKSSNYAILTGAELKENTFIPLDDDNHSSEYSSTDRYEFVNAIRTKILKTLKPINSPHEKKQEQ